MMAVSLGRKAQSQCAATTAAGKINLTLQVLGRRADGYHSIRSVFAGIGLYDSVECEHAHISGMTVPDQCEHAHISRVRLITSEPTIQGESNIAHKAAASFLEKAHSSSTVTVSLQKNIPIGAGLGGGSSDAAATLRLCNYLWNFPLSEEQLVDLGAAIGSDVPLFFALPCGMMEGRGEIVESFALGWRGWALLVFPKCPTSTAEVYSAWRPDDSMEARPTQREVFDATSADELHSLMFNDLEAAAMRVSPPLAEVYNRVTQLGFGPLRMSGSGSTLFRLFDERSAAESVARALDESGLGVQTAVVDAPVAPDPIVSEES